MQYEVIKAGSSEEALTLSKWKIGETAEIVGVGAIANSDGTFSVIPEFKPVPKPEEKDYGPIIVSEVCEADRVQSRRSPSPDSSKPS